MTAFVLYNICSLCARCNVQPSKKHSMGFYSSTERGEDMHILHWQLGFNYKTSPLCHVTLCYENSDCTKPQGIWRHLLNTEFIFSGFNCCHPIKRLIISPWVSWLPTTLSTHLLDKYGTANSRIVRLVTTINLLLGNPAGRRGGGEAVKPADFESSCTVSHCYIFLCCVVIWAICKCKSFSNPQANCPYTKLFACYNIYFCCWNPLL